MFRSVRLKKQSWVLLVVAAAGAVALSVGLRAKAGERGVTPDSFVTNRVVHSDRVLRGKSPSEKLRLVQSRLGSDGLVRAATLGGPPASFRPTDGTVPVPADFPSGKWAYFTVDAPGTSWASVRAIWEADLVTGVLRDAMHADGQVLYGTRVSLRLPDGTVVSDASGGIGNVDYAQEFPSPAAASVGPVVRAAAARAGLTVVSVDVLVPDQPAPALRVETTDPTAFVAHAAETIYQVFGNPPEYEGYYLRVDDARGNPVFVQGTGFRLGAGHEWIRPDLNPRLRAQHPSTGVVPAAPAG